MSSKSASDSILTLSRIITVFCVIGVVCNLFLPLFDGTAVNKISLQFAMAAVWIYGLLCSRGVFKKASSDWSDNKIEYSTSVPIVHVGVLRIIEAVWFAAVHGGEIIWIRYGILAVLDVVYIVLMLVDKMNYYYVGIRESGGEEDMYDQAD